MKKKLLSIMMVFAMSVALIAGCGDSGSTSTGGTASGSTEGDVTAENEEPYEIVVEMLGSGVAQTGTERIEAAINEITLPAINCTVKIREIPIADHATQLGLIGTDSDKLDIVFVGYTTSMQSLVANGLLLDITDYLDQYAPEMLNKAGVLMDACKINGGTYCVPGNYYPATKVQMVYDKESYDAVNGVVPENIANTYDWILEFGQAVKDSGFDGYANTFGDGFGVNIVGHNLEAFGASAAASGIYGELLDMEKDTQIVNIFATEEYKKECEYRKEAHDKGYVVPDSLTSGTTLVGSLMARQIIGGPYAAGATFVLGNKNLIGYEQTAIDIGEKATLTGASIPEYGLGVTVTCERPDKAVQLLNLIMTNPDLANVMNYGEEGKDYVKVSDRIIDYPEGVDWSNQEWGSQIVTFGDSAEIFHRTPYTEEWYDTLPEYGTENAVISTAFGYVFDAESVKTQVAAVTSVIMEFNPSLMCGVVDDIDGRLAEFNAQLEAAGINDIIAENQRQFDEWRASK